MKFHINVFSLWVFKQKYTQIHTKLYLDFPPFKFLAGQISSLLKNVTTNMATEFPIMCFNFLNLTQKLLFCLLSVYFLSFFFLIRNYYLIPEADCDSEKNKVTIGSAVMVVKH